MKRLVIAPNWIGDAVMSLPFLRALRRAGPNDRLTVLARRGPATIYRAEGSVDEVLPRSSFAADVLALRRGQVRRGVAPAELVSRGALRVGVRGATAHRLRHGSPREPC